jgi:hypothetical protein
MARWERNYKKHFYVTLIILIILLFLISLTAFRAYRNYSLFEQHRHYFKNLGVEAEIEPWMNIEIIESNFNMTKEEIVSYFNASSEINSEASLNRLCEQYNKNCTVIINDLNKQK